MYFFDTNDHTQTHSFRLLLSSCLCFDSLSTISKIHSHSSPIYDSKNFNFEQSSESVSVLETIRIKIAMQKLKEELGVKLHCFVRQCWQKSRRWQHRTHVISRRGRACPHTNTHARTHTQTQTDVPSEREPCPCCCRGGHPDDDTNTTVDSAFCCCV